MESIEAIDDFSHPATCLINVSDLYACNLTC
jgi:hypothetical protein